MTPYLITFVLAIASVGLWTLRVATTARGSRGLSATVSMVEATTYVVVISHLMRSLDEPMHIVAYALGVGAGTFMGLTLDKTMRAQHPPHLHQPSDTPRPQGRHRNRINA